MRMSAIRQETWLSRLDFSRLAARANTAAEKPADSSRSLVVSRIDSSSSTIATSGPLSTMISRWAVESDTTARGRRETIAQGGGGADPHLQTFQARKVCRRYDFGIDRLRRCGGLVPAGAFGPGVRLRVGHDLHLH